MPRAGDPLTIEATVSEKLHGRVHVAVVERFGRPNGRGDARMATHDLERARWQDFYDPMYRAAAKLAGVPFRVVERRRPTSA